MHPTRLPLYFYAMTKMPSLRRFLVLGLLAAANLARAQDPVTQFQMFGHFTANVELENDEQFSEFSMGEHDFFVQSKVTPRISFLSETIVAPVC